MTYAAMIGGLDYPSLLYKAYSGTTGPALSNETALAATADKLAAIGFVKMQGRATNKVVSAAGGGSIKWRSAAVTWANAGTSMDIGIQGVSTTAGPMPQPNGAFGVKRTLTGGDGNVTANATQTTAFTGGSGTSTISHGDLIAVVWDTVARAGADSVIVNCGGIPATTAPIPVTNLFAAAAWRTTGGKTPNFAITTDDGTLATLEETLTLATAVNEAFADATNPDERGLIFQVPWDCKVDGLWAMVGVTDADSDFTIKLYSDPLGTPASMGAYIVPAEQSQAAATDRYRFFPFGSEVELTANTNYVVAIRANGTSNTRLPGFTLLDAAHRALNTGGTTVAKVTRDGGAGAFTAESPAITMYNMGVRISSLNVAGGSYGMVGG